MARSYDSRLQKLKDRRRGPPDIQKTRRTADGFNEPIEESYQQRTDRKASMYALGAMQQVDPSYTANSFGEGDRVKNQLDKSFEGLIPVEFAYQGSVPLNVHIKGVSDIDLLLLRKRMVTIDTNGPKANYYTEWTGASPEVELSILRRNAEKILIDAFPTAYVDISGSKAITISGGSLRREVDVIPSYWYDTAKYQSTEELKDRGVYIFLKKENEKMLNFPFLHMHQITTKDAATQYNVKKVIRLLKTLIADFEGPGQIKLSSYDVASLVWHFDNDALNAPIWNELSLLWVAKSHLEVFLYNKEAAMTLVTPDGTRKIIDKEEKFHGLGLLAIELDALIDEVIEELNGFRIIDKEMIQRSLRESYIPTS